MIHSPLWEWQQCWLCLETGLSAGWLSRAPGKILAARSVRWEVQMQSKMDKSKTEQQRAASVPQTCRPIGTSVTRTHIKATSTQWNTWLSRGGKKTSPNTRQNRRTRAPDKIIEIISTNILMSVKRGVWPRLMPLRPEFLFQSDLTFQLRLIRSFSVNVKWREVPEAVIMVWISNTHK